MALFTHLKIILLQYFQFSAKISCIQTDSKISFGRRELNGMERNEKNHFRIFFLPLIWDLGVLMEGIESPLPCLGV